MHTPSKTATMRDPLRTASTPCVPRRAYSRLRIRRRLLPLLAGLTLTSGLALAAIAYAGMRAYAPANEMGIVLLLVTLLETALAVFCGLRFSGAPSNATLDRLDARLNDVASSAADLEQLVRAQVGRSQRQERLARQVSDSTREFNTLMEAVEQGQAALRETSSEIWAGMSQPGQALDPATATRLARQSAIIAGRIGAATEDSRERCRYLIGMMNQVIAEGRVLGDEGRVLEARANALRTSIERVEITLGAKVVCRQYDLPGNPFARRRRASRQLSDLASNGTPSGAYPRAGWQPAFNPSASQPAAPNGASLSGAHTISGIFPRDVQPGQGGQSSAQSSAQTTGQSSQWRPSQSSQWPGPALPFEQARPRTPTGPLPTANRPAR